MFNKWPVEKLQSYVEKLEEMFMQGVRQSTFKDQTLIFGSTSEIEQRLSKAYAELERRGELNANEKKKKMIHIQTTNDGFK